MKTVYERVAEQIKQADDDMVKFWAELNIAMFVRALFGLLGKERAAELCDIMKDDGTSIFELWKIERGVEATLFTDEKEVENYNANYDAFTASGGIWDIGGFIGCAVAVFLNERNTRQNENF